MTEKRKQDRFVFYYSVAVCVRPTGRAEGWESGTLCDIGPGGARFRTSRPFPAGTIISLLAHFRHPDKHDVTLRFEGEVTRATAESPCEVAVRFLKEGRFVKGVLGEALQC